MSNPVNDPVTAHLRVSVTVSRQKWARFFGEADANQEDLEDFLISNAAWSIEGMDDLDGTVFITLCRCNA